MDIQPLCLFLITRELQEQSRPRSKLITYSSVSGRGLPSHEHESSDKYNRYLQNAELRNTSRSRIKLLQHTWVIDRIIALNSAHSKADILISRRLRATYMSERRTRG
jgi:hypothetical protein